jgi:cbb3-type cytochrome oxidase cytochrome c subunit
MSALSTRPRALHVALLALLSALAVAALACSGSDPAPEPAPDPAAAASLTAQRGAFVDQALAQNHADWPAAARETVIQEGRATIERLECNRCHTIDSVEPSSRPTHCVSCHQWLNGLAPDDATYTKLAGRYGADVMERYQRNIVHYLEVPDLTRVGARLSPAWMATYIQNPHDLRPMMEETMVRSQVSAADARVIARYFAAVAETHDPYGEHTAAPPALTPVRPSPERIEEGRGIFLRRGCNLCHTVGNVDTGKTRADLLRLGAVARMAPNLRFARERMRPELAAAWILDPQRFHPNTSMPQSNLTPDEAEAVRDFLFAVDPRLGPTPPMVEPALPPAVDRPVSWAEVKESTLGRICVHCHMNDYERDNGPGNQGGYGWPGVGLRMRTYEALVSGQWVRGADAGAPAGVSAVVDVGARPRVSVLEPSTPGGLPLLLEAMLLRRVEERRDRVEAFADYRLPPDHGTERLGMPMGLPSIPDAELALLRAWIEQGCPGPTEVTGMPGIDDGFLVPDGPIPVNHGCAQRDLSEARPSWATQPPPTWAH